LQLSALSDGPLRGIFIRAPWIAEHGPGVEILAEVDGHAVAAREGALLAVAFHSELSEDDRVHRLFLRSVCDYAGAACSSACQPQSRRRSASSAATPPRRPNRRLASSRYTTTATLMMKATTLKGVVRLAIS